MLAAMVMGTTVIVLGGCPADTEVDERLTNGAHAVKGNTPGNATQPVCLAGDPFVAQGPVEVRDAGPNDAHRIEALRWASYAGWPAPRGDRVVVLEPRPGAASYPLAVTGYARTFEANVVVRLEQDGQEVYDDFTTATAWADAWGYFSFTIDQGPSGPVVLHVGEHSARDGTWEGVAIELEMS
jgi:hypothetical protein